MALPELDELAGQYPLLDELPYHPPPLLDDAPPQEA